MAGIKINLKGLSDKIYAQVKAELPSRAMQASLALLNAEVQVLAGQRSGRTYRSPTGGMYTASAPGEPPAVRTNTLRGQFRPATDGINPVIENFPASQYADYMEHGTPGGKIKPRPFKEKIIEMARPQIEAIYNAPYNFKL